LELIELKTNIRTSVGNSQARALRRQKQIPAVLYGRGQKSVLLSVYLNDLELALKKTRNNQALLNLVVQDHETYTKPAIIKELQRHPAGRNILHVDFYEIDMNRKIKVRVPVVTKGKSKGVELGGMLQIIRRELEVLCLPLEIPKSFEIDITDLDIGDSVHVKSIPLKDNIEIPADVNFTVLTIISPKAVEEAVPEEAEQEIEAEKAAAEKEVSKAES